MEYIIENEYLKVTITTWGAQIKSVIRKSDGVEHIWNADPSVWKFHGPVLFPYAGKLKDGKLVARGKTIENAPPHGVVRTETHTLVAQNPECLVLELEANERTLRIFPYQFRLLSTFELEGDTLHHTLTVVNDDTDGFSFGIGYHPGFALPFDDKHTATDYELRFSEAESPICLDTLPHGLLTGAFYYLGSNIRSLPVTEGMFDNDSFCMVNLRSETLGLYEKGTGRCVVCRIAEFPYCLLWSQPGMPRFICIEPWMSLPSAENGSCIWEEKPAAGFVSPGENWSTTMSLSFIR